MHRSHRMVDIDTAPAVFSKNPRNSLNQNLLFHFLNKCRLLPFEETCKYYFAHQ